MKDQLDVPCNESAKSFEMLCEWLYSKCETEMMTLEDLETKMKEFSVGTTYTKKWLKEKLKKHYGDHIYFTDIPGTRNVVCFRNMIDYIICNNWNENREFDTRVVSTAAKLVREEIGEIE